MQGALVDVGAIRRAVVLLVVGDEVLDGGDDVLALESLDVGHSQLRGQVGVLAQALETAAPYRVAQDVDGGRQDDVRALAILLSAEVLTVEVHQRRVPAGRNADGRGEGRHLRHAVRNSRRAILQSERRDTQSRIRGNIAHIRAADAGQHREFFAERHLCDERVCPLIGCQRGIHPWALRLGVTAQGAKAVDEEHREEHERDDDEGQAMTRDELHRDPFASWK